MSTDKVPPKVKYDNTAGEFYINYEGSWIYIRNTQGKPMKTGFQRKEVVLKTLILESFGKRKMNILQ